MCVIILSMNSTPISEWPTENQIMILRNSMLRLIPACEEVSGNFYSKLFESYPELRPMFSEDMEPQKEKLILMLASAIDMLGDPAEFVSNCAALGSRHVGYGALPAHYPIVVQLTLEELGGAAKPPLSAEETQAWNLLLNLISEHMLGGVSS